MVGYSRDVHFERIVDFVAEVVLSFGIELPEGPFAQIFVEAARRLEIVSWALKRFSKRKVPFTNTLLL